MRYGMWFTAVGMVFAATTVLAAPSTTAFRAGGILEASNPGPRRGVGLGLASEWPRAWGAIGVDAAGAFDVHGRGFESVSRSVVRIGPFARRVFGQSRLRPHLEAGLGLGLAMEQVDGFGGSRASQSRVAPAAWAGTGVAYRLSSRLDARVEARYEACAGALPDLLGSRGDAWDHIGWSLGLAGRP